MRCVDWNSAVTCPMAMFSTSHLVWGVWIEMFSNSSAGNSPLSHTSYEVCGLKYSANPPAVDYSRHTSYEVCGLKYADCPLSDNRVWNRHTSYEVCGLKWYGHDRIPVGVGSHLVWGVWIEIGDGWLPRQIRRTVTPRMRCVDWNGVS